MAQNTNPILTPKWVCMQDQPITPILLNVGTTVGVPALVCHRIAIPPHHARYEKQYRYIKRAACLHQLVKSREIKLS